MAHARTHTLPLQPLGTPPAAVLQLLLLLLAWAATAAETWKNAHDTEAQLLHQHWQRMNREQCFSFSLDQSIARQDFEYPDAITGERKEAKKGKHTYQQLHGSLSWALSV